MLAWTRASTDASKHGRGRARCLVRMCTPLSLRFELVALPAEQPRPWGEGGGGRGPGADGGRAAVLLVLGLA